MALIIFSLSGCASVQEDWGFAQRKNAKWAYINFLSKHPDSEFSEEARKKIDEFGWLKVKENNGTLEHRIYLHKRFILDHPDNSFIPEATTNLMILEWEEAKRVDTVKSYKKFLEEHPSGSYASKATDSIVRIKEEVELQAYSNVSKSKIRTKLERFLKDYPNSKYRETIQDRLSLFKTKTLSGPLILTYEEFGLNRPMSGDEASEKYSDSMNTTMPSNKLRKRADSIVVLHENSKFPGVLVGSIYGGRLNLLPYPNYHFPIIESPPDNDHVYFAYNFKLLLPVGTEFLAPKDQWIQWKNIELKGGGLRFLVEGVELSKGMKITLFQE
ncbi:MAG: hypothetical protein GY699_15195 [Desulfobacteraceae bacterium]|nr:hypothetical protein [Desulfobacteraceae bacterium]